MAIKFCHTPQSYSTAVG